MRYKRREIPRRKPSASELRRITRTRHIKWSKKGREFNIEFPFENSLSSPGSTDIIGGISAFLRQEQLKLAEELNEWEEEYRESEGRYNNNELDRISDVETSLQNIPDNYEENHKGNLEQNSTELELKKTTKTENDKTPSPTQTNRLPTTQI